MEQSCKHCGGFEIFSVEIEKIKSANIINSVAYYKKKKIQLMSIAPNNGILFWCNSCKHLGDDIVIKYGAYDKISSSNHSSQCDNESNNQDDNDDNQQPIDDDDHYDSY